MPEVKETSRFARLSAPFGNEVGGIINFLDEIKLWEISEGEIPTQFYTFNTMLKVYTLAFKFVTAVALIGNFFDILGYFWGVKLTPVWYAIIFFLLYQRYYGAFNSFGLTVYRTVITIAVITLFLVDNGFKLLVEVGLRKLLLLSSFPELTSSIPSYSPEFYHFVYLVTLFLPKKGFEGTKTKKLYSDEIVEISTEEYEKLVSTEGLGTKRREKVSNQPIVKLSPKKTNTLKLEKNESPKAVIEKTEAKGETPSDECSAEKIKDIIKGKIDESFDVFIWDKQLYVLKSLIPNCLQEGLKVKISKNGEVLKEGIYLRFKANEVLSSEEFKSIMRERFKNSEKRKRFQGLKVEVLGRN